jgi:hypothetical protein
MSAANWKAWNPLMTSKLSSRHGRRSIAPMRRYADAAGNAPAGDLDHALGGVDATDLGAARDRGEPEVPRIDDASTPASIPVARAFGPSLQTLASTTRRRPRHELGDARLHSQRRSAPLVREMTAAVSRTLSLAVRANQIRRRRPRPDRQPRRDRRGASTWLARHGRRDQLTHPQATGDNTP